MPTRTRRILIRAPPTTRHSPPTPIWAPGVRCRLPFTDCRFQGW
jgi:hypothetical protein